MSVTHPMYLVGMLAALTPIVIYLLLRRRKHEVSWGASYLLRLTLTSRKRSSLWKQLLVLACRALFIALVAVLLARVVRPNPSPACEGPRLPDRPVHRVILFDNSLSMAATSDTGRSRVGQGQRAVDALLRSQRPGDRVVLVPLLGGDREPVRRGHSLSREKRREMLGLLRPFAGRIDLRAGLAQALVELAAMPSTEAEIYVFSDFPRDLADDIDRLTWVKRVISRRGAKLVPVNLAGVPANDRRNIVIDSLELGTDGVLTGLPVTLYVNAVNYTDSEARAGFAVSVNGRPAGEKTVAFTPNERKQIPLTLVLREAGSALVEVTTDSSRLPRHGRRHYALVARDSASVWIAADDAEPVANGGSVPNLELLLRALIGSRDEPPRVELKRVTMADLSRPIPSSVDVIVLVGVSFAVPAARAPLQDYVRRGGGLVVSMDKSIQSAGYNESYGDLLPAVLGGSAHDSVDPAVFDLARAEPLPAASPLFRDLAGPRGGDFADVRFYNHLRVEPSPAGRVFFTLTGGASLLVHQPIGRGHVYVFTSSLGISWSSLTVCQAYLPFLYRLLEAAAVGRTLPRNLTPGGRLVTRWPAEAAVTLAAPDGLMSRATTQKWQGGHALVVEGLSQPGVYRLSDRAGNAACVTVRETVTEGDLRPLDTKQQSALSRALGAPIHSGWRAAVRHLGPADATTPLWPAILLVLLALYCFETWLVRHL